MRRVRLFDLEHLSLFSTMTDEEIETVLFATSLNDMGQPQAKLIYEDTLEHWGTLYKAVQRRRIRESLNRVDPRNTALRWGAVVSQRVYVVAHRWTSLINSLGICNSRMHRWLFTKNNFPSLQHKVWI